MAPKKAEAKAKPDAKPKAEKKPKKEEEDEASKVPSIPRPDKKAFDDKLEVLQVEIDTTQKKLKEVKDQIGERSSGNSDFQKRRSELRAQIDDEKEKIDAFMEKKNQIREQMGMKNEKDKAERNKLNEMKRSLPYKTIEDIDERISKIEMSMHHESITLKQEKEYMKEIAQLKKDKPKVENLTKMDAAVSKKTATLDMSANLKEQLDALTEAMKVHRDARDELNNQYTKLMQERNEQMGDSQSLFKDRDELNEQVRAKIQERNALRDEFRDQERKFYDFEKEQRNLRWEKQHAERERYKQEQESLRREREVEKLDDQPFVHETTLLEQTIKFCKGFQPKEEAKKEDVKETAYDNADGCQVLVSKGKREEEFYYAPTAKGKKAKTSKQRGKDSGGAKPIKHNAETFKLFAALKLDAPITTDDIPETLKKLEGEMEKYQARIKEWEAKRDERKEAILKHGRYDEPDEEKEEEEADGDVEKAEEAGEEEEEK